MVQDDPSQNCIFCKIVSGEIPANTVFEDDKVKVILDINPASEGHCLVLPKKHYQVMPQIPMEEIGYIFDIAKKTSHALLKGYGLQGTTIFVANGIAAGQKAPHFMVHVIPRHQGDTLFDIPKNHIKEKELNIIQKKLLKRFGVEVSETKDNPEKKEVTPSKSQESPDGSSEKNKKVVVDESGKKTEPQKKDEKIDIDSIANMFIK